MGVMGLPLDRRSRIFMVCDRVFIGFLLVKFSDDFFAENDSIALCWRPLVFAVSHH